MKLHPGALLSGLLALPALAAADATLDVRISGVKLRQGEVVVAVYRSDATWLKADQAIQTQKLASAGGDVLASFALPEGSYAVAVFQDANSNGKLDMQWLPPGPAEPWVMSRNAQGKFGPPAFDDARIEFPRERALSLTLQQP